MVNPHGVRPALGEVLGWEESANEPSVVSGGPSARLLADGRRLHLQHGPIDLIIEAFAADPAEIQHAYAQAVARFDDILATLVQELSILRQPVGEVYPPLSGPVARRMAAAVWPHRAVFITPMAAVAGAVADEMLAALLAGRRLDRAYVNNGGDIALHLAPGQRLRSGIVADPGHPSIDAIAEIDAAMPIRGIATSGWRGRSQSLGIADAATVLAASAAVADAAATLVANAVTVEHPAVHRRPARQVRDDSDLGDLPVTVAVDKLPRRLVAAALAGGARTAEALRARDLLAGALVSLQGQQRVVGLPYRPVSSRATPI